MAMLGAHTAHKNNIGFSAKSKVNRFKKGLRLTEKLVPFNPLLFLYDNVMS